MTDRRRPQLNRDKVLAAAVELADREGLEAVSMRRIGQELGVEAMSLYNHVANKDDILDAIVDLAVGEIEIAPDATGWRDAMRIRAHSTRTVLLRHPWASTLMESRTNVGPNRLRHFDAMMATLRRAGFDLAATHKAFMVLDSYIYGYLLQELNWPFDETQGPSELASATLATTPMAQYPHMLEMITDHIVPNGMDHRAMFDFGLELVLDGIEKLRHA